MTKYSGDDLAKIAKEDLVKEAKQMKKKDLNPREESAMGKVAKVLAKNAVKDVKKGRK